MTTIEGGDHSSLERLLLQQSETGEVVEIPRLNPSESYRTLGAWIAVDGNQQRQLEILQEKVDNWKQAISTCSLTLEKKQIAYAAFLRPQLVYPLGCTTIGDVDLKLIF